MEKSRAVSAARWMWAAGGSRLFAADGVEYHWVDDLERVEIERLLTLDELGAARVECGSGIVEWVGPADARRELLEVERDFRDNE